ncbi:serine--tRNA ligase [Candidatus Saccharibacteria bacterium]|nr:serine--tRNA ligase [Candidatus Saccharibacteria bacterium]MCB9821347.1 serine--tRNA ligase [Candidatus Nomurabacteria bacterium]
MLDIDFIRNNTEIVKTAVANKGASVDIGELLELDQTRRGLITRIDELRAERNKVADQMKGGKPDQQLIDQGKELKDQTAKLEAELEPLLQKFDEMLYAVPNMPSDDTPVGDSEAQNVITKTWGDKPSFDFTPKAHWEMPQFIDEERAVRISGARFAFLKNGLVKLQFALLQFGLDTLTSEDTISKIAAEANLKVSAKPFIPMLAPMMLRTDAYKATGRLKPEEVTFKLANDDLWLTGSSEHALCAYHLGETLDEADLPLRYVGYNTAFRREVGSAGKDTRGIIRQHHFDKLEMESFTTPETSRAEHELLIAIQEYIMQSLGMPYQLVLKCTFDQGGPNIRGLDVETWMAGQGTYRETHTADYIGDYQSRGLNTKYKTSNGEKLLVHTNDATATAQRTLAAILENNQTADGRVKVPEVLRSYMGGVEYI